MRRRKMKRSRQDKLFILANYVLATLLLLITMYPLWFVVIASFSDPGAVLGGEVWLIPKEFTLRGYEMMLQKTEIWVGYRNTIVYTVLGTLMNLFFTIPPAYALSRGELPFRRQVNFYFILTMYLGAGMVPTYMVVKGLGMVDTLWVMIVLGAVNVYNMIICRTTFESSIPKELIEAASIDGCSELGIFARIVLPLSKAIAAVMTLYFAVGHWNSYAMPKIYLRSESRYTLQQILTQLLQVSNEIQAMQTDVSASTRDILDVQGMKFGVIIIASVPVLIMYPFVQKHFVKGVMIGAVKG